MHTSECVFAPLSEQTTEFTEMRATANRIGTGQSTETACQTYAQRNTHSKLNINVHVVVFIIRTRSSSHFLFMRSCICSDFRLILQAQTCSFRATATTPPQTHTQTRNDTHHQHQKPGKSRQIVGQQTGQPTERSI